MVCNLIKIPAAGDSKYATNNIESYYTNGWVRQPLQPQPISIAPHQTGAATLYKQSAYLPDMVSISM